MLVRPHGSTVPEVTANAPPSIRPTTPNPDLIGTRALSVPTALAWSAVDGFLYAVDETRRGLVQVALVGTGGLAITRVVE
jgi:hypothetical protein